MKLVIGGSTGWVTAEIIRQALPNPAITSIVALGRRPAAVPQDERYKAHLTKLKSVICDDFENYSDTVKQELSGADACIWTIGTTPSTLKDTPWEQVCKVSRDYAVRGLEQMSQLPRGEAGKPFRFIYMSGNNAERDPAKKPMILGDLCLLRGEAETLVLKFAEESNGAVEACVAKPGLIGGPGRSPPPVLQKIFLSLIGLPKVHVREISATLIDQVLNGFEKDTLRNEDLVRIGQKILGGRGVDGVTPP